MKVIVYTKYGPQDINWETSFCFASILGIVLTWIKSREIKEKLIFQLA
jgi:hypothetical protein